MELCYYMDMRIYTQHTLHTAIYITLFNCLCHVNNRLIAIFFLCPLLLLNINIVIVMMIRRESFFFFFVLSHCVEHIKLYMYPSSNKYVHERKNMV